MAEVESPRNVASSTMQNFVKTPDPAQNQDNIQSEMRKSIMNIQSNPNLTAQEKAQKVQQLMMKSYVSSRQKQREPRTRTHRHACCQNDGSPSYHDAAKNILGCRHYRRSCKVKAPCCGMVFPCRICHDEQSDHTMDRYQTKEMICMKCNVAQPAAQFCANEACKEQMSAYYCDVCKLWDDDKSKSIYHCHQCNLCRIGKGLGIDYFHCDKCNICMSMGLQGKHRCIERSLECDCPICGEYMFTSTRTVMFMPCGHCMHFYEIWVIFGSRCDRHKYIQ
eukprot:Colp12_sorted_trinity150504_noHs@4307